MRLRAGLYARVSTEEQIHGYSIEVQLDAMRRFCKERDWTIEAEYIEPGHTATVKERTVFTKLLADCQAGRIDVLITHQLDRFYRNLRLQLETLGQLGQWGVRYVSVTEQIDYTTPEGLLFMSMLGAFNEYFSKALSAKVRRGKLARARSGLSNSPYPPIGYKRVKGSDVYMIDEETAPGVIRAFELYSTGQYSYLKLAMKLASEGYPSGPKGKGVWTERTAITVFRSRFYIGEVRYKDPATGEIIWFPGKHKPLISQELWDKVQEIKATRAYARQPNTKRTYLLQGLLRCSNCGNPLYSETHTFRNWMHSYYRDSAHRKGELCPYGDKTIRVTILDKQVEAIVTRLHLPSDWQEQIVTLANADRDAEEIQRKRQRLYRKLSRLRFLFLEGDMGQEDYRAERDKILSQIQALPVSTETSMIEAGEYLESLGTLWQAATTAQRHELLKGMIEHIEVDVGRERIVSISPYPEFREVWKTTGLEERNGKFYP